MTRFIQLITLSSVLPIMMGGGWDEEMQSGLGIRAANDLSVFDNQVEGSY